MQLLRGLHNPGLESSNISGMKCVATIGNFDGVHLGHQAIIKQVLAEAKKRNLPSLVVIFEPQPMEFFKGDQAPARLMRFREKYQALSEFDIDYVFCLKFDESLSQLSAESFVQKVLVSHLSIEHLVIGDDFRFGGDRLGDFALLKVAGQKYGFSVEHTSTVLDEGADSTDSIRVSSTYVRSLLLDGRFAKAEEVLGRPYELMGRVIHGEKLGRQLGFPTANIALKRVKAPFAGVYAVSLKHQKKNGSPELVLGVANVGVKPTVGNFRPSLEVHLLNFTGNLYGEKVSVYFYEKLRDETRFESIEELKVQIKKDIEDAESYFEQSSEALN